jgi:2-hydroxychromene-2-carboxylate isomerase
MPTGSSDVSSTPTIDFMLDFLSPFGYLARGRLLAIAQKHGARVHYHPIDLVAVKRAVGNTGPSNRDIPAKIAYLTEDLQRWAQRYGLPMVRTLPGANTGRMNRGLLLAMDRDRADDYVRLAWDCVWRDGLDPGLEETLAELCRRLDWERNEFMAFVDGDDAMQRYAAENANALAQGVFGVPTFLVGRQMFWGNDRLDFLEEHLASIVA